jgi:hypothetical protein
MKLSLEISNRNKLILRKMNATKNNTLITYQNIQRRNDNIKRVNGHLTEIEKIKKIMYDNNQLVDKIFKQLDDIQEILPKPILKKIKSPLFKTIEDEEIVTEKKNIESNNVTPLKKKEKPIDVEYQDKKSFFDEVDEENIKKKEIIFEIKNDVEEEKIQNNENNDIKENGDLKENNENVDIKDNNENDDIKDNNEQSNKIENNSDNLSQNISENITENSNSDTNENDDKTKIE